LLKGILFPQIEAKIFEISFPKILACYCFKKMMLASFLCEVTMSGVADSGVKPLAVANEGPSGLEFKCHEENVEKY
jgi:hypothetical protein